MTRRLRVHQMGNQLLGLANGELFRDCLFCRSFQLLRKSDKTNQNFAVTKTELSVFQSFLKRLGKLEQADEIGNARTVFAGASCNLLLGKSEFPAESFKSASLLHRVQVFALQVLDDGDLHRLLVGDLADGSGDGGSSGPLRGEPA